MKTDAVILAGGYSSRAKGFKMEFLIEGKPVISHVIDAFYPFCENIIVVGGFRHQKLVPLLEPYWQTEKKVRLIVNEKYEKGMFTSVKAGISFVTSGQFFLTPGDYPLLGTQLIKEMLAQKKDILIPVYHQSGGHPVLMNSTVIPQLLGKEDDYSLREFLKSQSVSYLDFQDEAVISDIDTREDYNRIVETFEKNRKEE